MNHTSTTANLLLAWPVDGLDKVFADTSPPTNAPTTISLTAAAGECEVAQIAVHAPTDELLLDLPEVSALTSDKAEIPPDRVTCRFVELVPVRFSTQGVPTDELIRIAPGYYPDPLCLEDCMCVPAGQTRTVHLRVDIPRDTPAGRYKGSIKVKTSGGDAKIAIDLTVWPICLPEHIPCAMTLWVWPAIIAKYHCVQLYSEPFWKLLEGYAAEMAAHRQDTIFTTILGPDALIDITKTSQGYTFDFTRFDRWVKLFLDAGFTQIEGGHLYDRWYKFVRVQDETLGKETLIEMGPTLQAFSENVELMTLLSHLFEALRDHVRQAGWSDCYMQHIYDEPAGEQIPIYFGLVELVRNIWPDVPFIDAADAEPKILDALGILVPLVDSRFAFRNLPQYHLAGKTCWCYTCNHPRGRYPNVFLDSPLLKTRIIPWIMYRYGITGFLYYALGYWENQHDVPRDRFDPHTGELDTSMSLYNPWLDPAQNATWQVPPGSSGFVYPPRDPCSQDPSILAPKLVENFNRVRAGHPSVKEDEAPNPRRMKTPPGVVGSLRWEQLREGIEDYGLLCLLDEEITKAAKNPMKRSTAKQTRANLDRLIQTVAPDWENYTRDPAAIETARREVAQNIIMLRELKD